MNDLGKRMKENYEDRYRIYLTRRTPVIVRVDGKSFHTLTSKFCMKPFDGSFMDAMVLATLETSKEMQGFKMGYIQSDEASFLLTDFDKLETDAWFDYNLSKIVSVTASLMSVNFFWEFKRSCFGMDAAPVFDARAFNIPLEEVSNYFLWRCKDWERNSLSMYCQSFFSHKELEGYSRAMQHEMLHSIGKSWSNDLTPRQKNGTFIIGEQVIDAFIPSFETVNIWVEKQVRVEGE